MAGEHTPMQRGKTGMPHPEKVFVQKANIINAKPFFLILELMEPALPNFLYKYMVEQINSFIL